MCKNSKGVIMRISFNPIVSNNNQKFGAVNSKILAEIKEDSGLALTSISDMQAFNSGNKSLLRDLKDTIEKALELGYVVGENAKKLYKDFIKDFLS